MSTLVALGKAFELVFVRDGKSNPETVSFPGWWWAWDGSADAGNILLVKPVSFRSRTPRGTSTMLHARFHGDDPDKSAQVLAPNVAATSHAGLVISFAYDARGFSTSKKRMPYRHHFGAETHSDKPPFPESDLPSLALSPDGGLVIKRRRSNNFRLQDWVVG